MLSPFFLYSVRPRDGLSNFLPWGVLTNNSPSLWAGIEIELNAVSDSPVLPLRTQFPADTQHSIDLLSFLSLESAHTMPMKNTKVLKPVKMNATVLIIISQC